jgi:hypothetical protein
MGVGSVAKYSPYRPYIGTTCESGFCGSGIGFWDRLDCMARCTGSFKAAMNCPYDLLYAGTAVLRRWSRCWYWKTKISMVGSCNDCFAIYAILWSIILFSNCTGSFSWHLSLLSLFTLHGVVPGTPFEESHHQDIVTMAISYLFIGSTAWCWMILCDSGVLDMADALPGILKGLTPHVVWHLAAGLGGYCAVIQLVCCRCEALAPISITIVGVSCRCLWKKQIRHQRLVRINNENQRRTVWH